MIPAVERLADRVFEFAFAVLCAVFLFCFALACLWLLTAGLVWLVGSVL